MVEHTDFYGSFTSGVFQRRKALILQDDEKTNLFPDLGQEWNATFVENTKCDAFILFFVAELENYLENIIEEFIARYESTFKKYFLKECLAGDTYIPSIKEKLIDIKKNHNANWKKISPLFSFIGMSKESHFPQDYWDRIDQIVGHRGHIAHKGIHIQVDMDRRLLIDQIDIIITETGKFDRKVFQWFTSVDAEIYRISALSGLSFSPIYVAE